MKLFVAIALTLALCQAHATPVEKRGIFNVIKNVWNTGKSGTVAVVGTLKDSAGDIVDTVKGAAGNIKGTLLNSTYDVAGTVKNTATDVTGKMFSTTGSMIDIFTDVLHDLYNAGNEAEKKLKDVSEEGFVILQIAATNVEDFVNSEHEKEYQAAKTVYNNIKDDVESAAFDEIVDNLIPLIDSDETIESCVVGCDATDSQVLGVDPKKFAGICEPVCKGALAKLEDVAERLAKKIY